MYMRLNDRRYRTIHLNFQVAKYVQLDLNKEISVQLTLQWDHSLCFNNSLEYIIYLSHNGKMYTFISSIPIIPNDCQLQKWSLDVYKL